MLLRVYASSKTVLTFVIIYWVSLSLVVITLKKTIKHINKKLSPAKSSYKHLLLIASLAGMPPTVGFLAKWYLLKSLRMINIILMLLIVLTLTSINLFIYLRIIIFINIIKPSPKKKYNRQQQNLHKTNNTVKRPPTNLMGHLTQNQKWNVLMRQIKKC